MAWDYVLEREQIVKRPVDEVFSFFAEAQNLERITPPFMAFKILTPMPMAVEEGSLIDYKIGLHGIPMKWRTRISVWEPGVRFVDEQLKGPYAKWHHLHEFHEHPEGTLCYDRVDYRLPFGPLGPIAHALNVKSTLKRIFDYRHEAIEEIFHN